ncbi:hypothetical protein PVK06_040641 [Gossypium arboreum]|uniref:CCHC-type domain-containing protein n=1 Tax=Gossypium arboreum TaxID=29729 RepID=A0ABR0N6R6_GOSAR|nr:hypothetical protein PVK06_040641 [Gossypium arboreum]
MVHIAIKVKKQLKRKRANRFYPSSSANKWSQGMNKVINRPKKPFVATKTNQTSGESSKNKNEPSSNRSHNIKCFKCQGRGHIASQCLNHRVMMVCPNSEIESEDEKEEEPDIPTDKEE